jgi:integrase
MQLRPHLADRGTFLAVNWGTKGGRDRVIPIETPEQRAVLESAKSFANSLTASMSDPALSLPQAKRLYYRVMAKCGITREASKITSYGLRHGKSNDKYLEVTGQASPVRGGGPVAPQLDQHARQIIAEELGHSRAHITTNYLGRR